MKRQSGVLMHVSSLYGEYSIGSFGREALEFIDFIAEAGFSVWQVLPFGMTDEYNSPYKSVASLGANPYFIDLPTLYEKGLLDGDDLAAARQTSPYLAEYDRLSRERLDLLYKASERAAKDPLYVMEMDEMLASIPLLVRVAEYLALRDKNCGLPRREWTVTSAEDADADRLFFWRFVQYEFYTQWMRVKKYANEKGIMIIGDLPMYVDLESADVYAHRGDFQLDGRGYPTAVAGVPPDAFSEEGQLWGNPLYDWDAMKENGYRFWRERIEYSLTLFDGIRIDHFRALSAYFSIPCNESSAKMGKWKKGPGRPIIDLIRKVAGDKLVIAEDLGVITKDVISLLKYSKMPGMRVFQFGFLEGADCPHLPHNYTENCVAYSGTHDNNTLLGYLFECSEDERRKVFDYCSAVGDDISSACETVIKTLLMSRAGTVVFPVQDLLAFGRDTRMNTPGTPSGNWAYRVTRDQLFSIDRERLLYLNSLYARK